MHRGLKLTAAVLICIIWCFIPLRLALANDIQITNLTVHPHNAGTGEVEFDVTWSNSWRSTTEPYNWDAAWIFCKIRRNGGDWTHLKLNTTGHTIPSTPQAITTAIGLADTGAAHNASTNPAVGIFMYRANDGFGTFTANDVRLKWNYADNGASSSDVVEIRVFGIEMVYIPEGAFYAGDNATSDNAFREKETGDNDPWSISSENAIITTTSNTGNYYYPGTSFTIASTFPKGFGAIYMMKGEFSQGQYVAFFNTLTATQKVTRDLTSSSGKNTDSISYRNNINWTTGDAFLNGGTHAGVANNYMSGADVVSELDWSGLRPMSELEFEKAARGPTLPVSGEFAWGSTSVTPAITLSNDGLANERAQAGSNCSCTTLSVVLQGPVRVGSFSKGVTSRRDSGAGFYGVMELTGSVTEYTVMVTEAFDRRYHGNGELASDGAANVTSWPAGFPSGGVMTRGGGWDNDETCLRISNRFCGAHLYREYQSGGRGVRTAP